ncbi:hypothetical protein Vafri_12597, partial [Volvox africanus]
PPPPPPPPPPPLTLEEDQRAAVVKEWLFVLDPTTPYTHTEARNRCLGVGADLPPLSVKESTEALKTLCGLHGKRCWFGSQPQQGSLCPLYGVPPRGGTVASCTSKAYAVCAVKLPRQPTDKQVAAVLEQELPERLGQQALQHLTQQLVQTTPGRRLLG